MQMVARHRYSVRDTYRITAQAARTVVRHSGQVQCDQQFAGAGSDWPSRRSTAANCAPTAMAKFARPEAGMDSSEVRDLLEVA